MYDHLYFAYTCMDKEQLRNVRRKLESDFQGNKKRHSDLTEQCNALKKGREESVSVWQLATLY